MNKGLYLTEFVNREGHKIGAVSCELCGVTILRDTYAPVDALKVHNNWHEEQERRFHEAATDYMRLIG